MQSETLAQEFTRLVKEYHEGDDHTKPEAWNLLADYAVDNADAITAALSDKQAGEVKALEWIYREQPVRTYCASDDRGDLYWINQSFGSDSYYFTTVRRHDGAILYDADDLEAAKAAAQADYEQRIRSALVDVPAVEPVAWQKRHCMPGHYGWSSWESGRAPTTDFSGLMWEERPLYASPLREGEDSAEVIPADLVERCTEILEWKKTGKLPGTALRELGQSIADQLGNSLFIDGGLGQAEIATVNEALQFVVALAATRSGSTTTAKGISDAGN